MVYVFLPNGQRLRLRLYPRHKKPPKNGVAEDVPNTLLIFEEGHDDAAFGAANEKLAAKVVESTLINRVNAAILERFPRLGLRDWWLTSGCIAQTVWNLRSGRPAGEGIADYDVVYFSEDISAEAEEQVRRDAAALFADLNVALDVRNQARVHLWYPDKFGISYSPLTSAGEGILRFPSTTTAVGLKCTGDDFLDVYAPFGLSNLWDMVVKPNRTLPLAEIYKQKAARWQTQWPRLIVRPWVVDVE